MNNSRVVDCEAECGVDWASPETLALARQRIKDRFGSEVRLDYLDIADNALDDGVPGWNNIIKEEQFSFPALFLNGHLRISGKFDFRRLLDSIEVEVEEVKMENNNGREV